MALPVSDRSSNKPEQIEHAAEILGRSAQRIIVFRKIYTGKEKIKTVRQLAISIGLTKKRVLECGKKLATQDIVEQVKVNGQTAYKKIDFLQQHRDKIIRLAENPEERNRLSTKRRPETRVGKQNIKISLPKQKIKAIKITIDDIESFKEVRKIKDKNLGYTNISEKRFKNGIAKILGERGEFKDWGGENNDLLSTRLYIKNTRKTAAFAFKGPGTKGKLTPGKMGKNGDQIQRLAKCKSADAIIVQYWEQIDDSVIEQLGDAAKIKSYMEDKTIWYGIIDGEDSTKLIRAYPKEFS
jgi:hypothetical protein